MPKPIIEIENIGKAYHLGQAAVRHEMFRDALIDTLKAPFRRFKELRRPNDVVEPFWALRNISFDVQQGEVVGIIGRNGAGKSTLLKILSRITEPTEGQVTLRGRVASLLEVGTGFHPELTGRENVYLNGVILGMSKAEIARKFDEIVAFSEIEKFLDTPVKRYSSGMYVRLAFAVAAHLEPEILIIDEVLAVGDVEFQKKCLGKMGEVTKEGRTVLFVSHNMAAVRSLCGTTALLEQGQMVDIGSSHNIIDRYLSRHASQHSSEVHFSRPGHAPVWMTRACILSDGEPSPHMPLGSDLTLQVDVAADPATMHPRIGFVVCASDGTRLLCANNRYQPSTSFTSRRKYGTILCHLGQVPLMPGSYTVSLYLGDQTHDTHIELDALAFAVLERDIWGLENFHPEAFPLCGGRLNSKWNQMAMAPLRKEPHLRPLNAMNSIHQPYDIEFFDCVRRTSVPSAEVMVPLVVKMLNPQSVVDVGCGEGSWLSVFAREGVKRILGIDGDYVNQDRLLIRRECFQARDLTQPFTVDEPFDLALSLEVGEHLPERAASSYVSSLGGVAPVILFSAAIPGQGGMEHVNEQWPSYWAARFASCGFDCFDILRQRLWNDDRIAWWYRQNVLLFAKLGSSAWSALSAISEPRPPKGLIHPDLWVATQQVLSYAKARAEDPGLRLSVVHILRTLRRRFL